MSNKKTKKQHIFEFYLKALNSIVLNEVDFAICPLCMREFVDINQFSLEHIPPESQDGKDIFITCTECK